MKNDQANSTSQAVTDDQDLAQVLAAGGNSGGLQFEAAPVPGAVAEPVAASADETSVPAVPGADQAPQAADDTALTAALDEAVQSLPDPVVGPSPTAPVEPPAQHGAPHTGSNELDEIKQDALKQLRPLVDKLDLKADEKFDTLLLIIRSTDDKSLLGPAHKAAKAIEDDTKRAQALLDVIKEIDYFSSQSA